MVLGELAPIPIYGSFSLPAYAVAGLSIGGASLVASIAENYILGEIPGNKRYSTLEGALLAPAVTGPMVSGVLYLTGVLRDDALIQTFAIGACCEIGGTYLNDAFVSPMMKKNE